MGRFKNLTQNRMNELAENDDNQIDLSYIIEGEFLSYRNYSSTLLSNLDTKILG